MDFHDYPVDTQTCVFGFESCKNIYFRKVIPNNQEVNVGETSILFDYFTAL